MVLWIMNGEVSYWSISLYHVCLMSVCVFVCVRFAVTQHLHFGIVECFLLFCFSVLQHFAFGILYLIILIPYKCPKRRSNKEP
jgi:hypothetical protein